MASTSRHASSSYGVGGSTIVQSTTAAAAELEEDQSPIDRDVLTRSPVDVSRHPTVYENSGEGISHALRERDSYQQGFPSRPPSAQPRRSANVSRIGTSRVDSPSSDINYPSWLPRRPLAPPPPASTDNSYRRSSSATGYNYGAGRLADLFSFSRGHSRHPTQDTNRVSTAMSGFITNPSDYGAPPGRRTTDGSNGRKETGDSGGASGMSYPYSYDVRRGSSGNYDPRVGIRLGTPRSIRIASESIDHGRGQEPTEQTRIPSSSAQGHAYSHVRRFSRGATSPYAVAMASQSPVALHSHQGWMSTTALGPPAPRFRARNLNLALLQSPSKFIRFRYLLQPLFFFAHIPLQLFFDFNVVYMLVQITKYPTPLAPGVPNTTPYPPWLFALITYLFCIFLWLVGVVLIYEVAWCFWRRWRVKRPGMLGIFSSRPARKLVGMGSYDRFCFLEYVQRGAWTDRTELDMLMERERDIQEEEERESMGGGWEGKEALRHAREEEQQQLEVKRRERGESKDDDDDAESRVLSWPEKLQLLNYKQGLIEWAWNRSQNLPTVALLIPRACIALTIILVFTKVNPLTVAALNSGQSSTGSLFTPVNPTANLSDNTPALRDAAFFSSSNGTLTGYAKAVLWIDCIWTLWRTLILIGAYVALWVASGQSCAGVCGPRFRWEEIERQEWEDATNAGLAEKHGSISRRHLSLSGESTVGGVDTERGDIADQLGWEWRENTRRRVREAYEFCLLAPLSHRRHSSLRSTGDLQRKDPDTGEPLTALEQALLTSRHQGRKGLVPGLFEKPHQPLGKRESLQLVPPSTHLPLTSSDPNAKSAPMKELPYPFPSYQPGDLHHRDSIPFPSPEPHAPRHNDPEVEELEAMDGMEDLTASQMEELVRQEEERRYLEEEGYVEGIDEMGYIKERPASASLSSLGQPLHPRYQQFGHRTRSSVSTGPGSYQSPRTSGYISSKSNSGDQSGRRKSSVKSSGSQYSPRSPRTNKSSGSQQSPTDSSGKERSRIANILPPPSAGSHRAERRRIGHASSSNHLPVIPSPIPTEVLTRSRTHSSRAQSGVYDVQPQPPLDGSDNEDEQEHQVGGDDLGPEEIIIAGSPGDEHEDSIGLLSQTPSHQGSLAAIRQRASSLSSSIHRLRTRSQGTASHSNSNSGSGEARRRTRSSAAHQSRPESHAMSSLGSGSRSRSTSHSGSRTSSLIPVIGARYTSPRTGSTTEFGVMRPSSGTDLINLTGPEMEDQGLPPLPPLPGSSQTRVRAESSAPSERTIQPLQQQPQQPGRLAVPPNIGLDTEHPNISEARESFITLPPSIDTASTNAPRAGARGARGASGNNASSQTVSTWANVPGYFHDPTPQP